MTVKRKNKKIIKPQVTKEKEVTTEKVVSEKEQPQNDTKSVKIDPKPVVSKDDMTIDEYMEQMEKDINEVNSEVTKYHEDLTNAFKDKILTVKQRSERLKYIINRIEDLQVERIETTDKDGKKKIEFKINHHPEEPIDKNIVPELTDDNLAHMDPDIVKRNLKNLEDTLTLLTLEKLMIKKSALSASQKETLNFIKRAQRAIESTYIVEGVPTPSISLNKVYSVLVNLAASPKEMIQIRKVIIRFCKAIISNYKDYRFYFNNIILNIGNIPFYYSTKNKQGKKETSVFLKALSRIANDKSAKNKPVDTKKNVTTKKKPADVKDKVTTKKKPADVKDKVTTKKKPVVAKKNVTTKKKPADVKDKVTTKKKPVVAKKNVTTKKKSADVKDK